MKGVLLFLGLAGIVFGIVRINELQGLKNSTAGTYTYAIDKKFREDYENEKLLAIGFVVVGGVLFIWGVTSSKRKQSVRIATKVSPTSPASTIVVSSPTKSPDTITQLERLAKLKEQGVLTEEEFQKEKSKIVG